MARVELIEQGLAMSELPTGVRSLDVFFDEQRVWSIDLHDFEQGQERLSLAWPDALSEHLIGSTRISVRDSASRDEIAVVDCSFTPDPVRMRLEDESGFPLVINKWGRLGRALDSMGEAMQEVILERTQNLIEQLQEMGLRPFIVGGTLLGAVRDGKLLPHDDDADIAYLSEHTDPFEVAREGFQIGHKLEKLGYRLQRHSATHMQLHFDDDSDLPATYIDVFGAFFTDDGYVNQPFHVRGKMRPDQMLPFSSVNIGERSFPAPADPDRWLTINYDADWRIPIPGYRLATPEPTSRRFNAWFGWFNLHRDFWNDLYSDPEVARYRWAAGRAFILEHQSLLTSPMLIDLGGGGGELAELLQRPGREVVAADYAAEPLALAKARAVQAGFQVAHLNLARLNALGMPSALGMQGAFDVTANHVLEQVGHEAREVALRIIRMALKSGGTAIAVLHGRPSDGVNFDDPTGWHLTRFDLAREALKFGMQVVELPSDIAAAESEGRDPYGVQFTLATGPARLPQQEVSLKQKVARVVRSLRGGGGEQASEIEELRARVDQLQRELDEYRAHSGRLAQLLDLAEERLTPDSED